MTAQSRLPEQIEDEIRVTRRDIDRTLDALQQRASPGQLLDQMLGYARSGGTEFATNFARTITQNPVPVSLLGIGCLWLMCSRSQTEAQPSANIAPAHRADPSNEGERPTPEGDGWT